MNMTPQQASDWLMLLPVRVTHEIFESEMNTIVTGRSIAWAMTSGPFKSEWLRKHRPGLYSRKSPRPPADPALINTQSDQLRSGWQHSQGMRASGDIITALFNQTDSARAIAGSGTGRSRMMHRPVEERIAERLAPVRLNNLTEAIRKALTP